MPWRDIGLQAAGLFLYPGLLAMLVIGLLLEAGISRVPLPGRPEGSAGLLRRMALRGEAGLRALSVPAAGAVLFAAIAAMELAAPLSPVPAGSRNLLTGAVALIGSAWLSRLPPRGDEGTQSSLLTVQLAWLVALLVPAVIPQTLKPQTLGYVTFNLELPLKVACGLLYLLCLPALLQLLAAARPDVPAGHGMEAPDGPRPDFGGDPRRLLRLFLWFPHCGLFASLFFSPGADSPLELLRFLSITAGAAVSAVLIALLVNRLGPRSGARFYSGVVVPFAWISLGFGMISAAIDSR